MQSLLACRALADAEERLRCLDSQSAALQAQLERGDLVVTTRTQIAHAQEAQFGRNAPVTPLVEPERAKAPPPPRSINTSIRSVGQSVDGKWVMVLADGARWQQIDSRMLARDPRPGMTIAIRRAAMGSFLANVDGQTAMRVRRVD